MQKECVVSSNRLRNETAVYAEYILRPTCPRLDRGVETSVLQSGSTENDDLVTIPKRDRVLALYPEK